MKKRLNKKNSKEKHNHTRSNNSEGNTINTEQ